MEENSGGAKVLGISVRQAGLICGLVVFGLLIWIVGRRLAASPPAEGVEIQFIDVGQGDAALITSAEGRNVLIDAGPNPSLVADYLNKRHINTLDLIIASHNHADHIGGLPAVLKQITVRNYMDNGLPAATGVYRRIVDLLTKEHIRVLTASPRVLTLGSMQIRILPLPPGLQTQNNQSVGALITDGKFKALFTGDSQVEEIAYWLSISAVTPVTVLKIAHHGSNDGTTEDWVHATEPRLAVVSVGAHNKYGHPGGEAMQAWASPGRRILRTDRDGTIVIHGFADGRFEVSSPANH